MCGKLGKNLRLIKEQHNYQRDNYAYNFNEVAGVHLERFPERNHGTSAKPIVGLNTLAGINR